MNPAPYDITPLLPLLGVACGMALLPLMLWIKRYPKLWRSFWHPPKDTADQAMRQTWLKALLLTTLFLTFDLIVFGSFTRLTDSGLGCPDWPGCYGAASPWGAKHHIEMAQTLLPTGPVTHSKAWIEMIHRYLAMTVGALITLLVVLSWRYRRPIGGLPHPITSVWRWAVLCWLWVCLQGAFGAWTVTFKLMPVIVTLHLLLGLGLLMCLRWTLDALTPSEPLQHSFRWFSWIMWLIALIQVALGGWVSTNYAILACGDFPMCQGAWWPEMAFQQAFTLWRPLGQQADGSALTFEALVAVAYVHRLWAYGVLVLGLGWVVWAHTMKPHRKRAYGVLAILCLQIATGISNVLLDGPLLTALFHSAGAAALLGMLSKGLLSKNNNR